MMFFSTIFEIVNPINRIAASMRKEILMMTSVLRPKFTFLNNHIFFILMELMLVVVETGIDTR
jgi:hypothetical protein